MVPKGFPGADQNSKGEPDNTSSMVVSHHDGAIAYSCQANPKKVPSPIVWTTRDTGANWAVITPSGLPAGIGGCKIILDDNDARTLIISFYPILSTSFPAGSDQWVTYASFDSGETWSKPTGLQNGTVILTLASSHGRFYALQETNMLYISNDYMQHWTRIDTNLPKTSSVPSQSQEAKEIVAMWVNPTTGGVLAQVRSQILWSTKDDGAHWAEIPYPSAVFIGDPNGPALTVGFPATHGYPIICGVFNPILSGDQQRIECTTDGGQTWTDRATSSDSSLGVAGLFLLDIGYDGSLIALGYADSKELDFAFYRLAPSVMTENDGWQRIGAIPNSGRRVSYQVIPSAAGIMFWAFPTSTTTNGQATTQPNYYVATY